MLDEPSGIFVVRQRFIVRKVAVGAHQRTVVPADVYVEEMIHHARQKCCSRARASDDDQGCRDRTRIRVRRHGYHFQSLVVLPGESGRGTSPATIVYRPQPADHPVSTCRVSCFRHDYVPRVCDEWRPIRAIGCPDSRRGVIDFVGDRLCETLDSSRLLLAGSSP